MKIIYKKDKKIERIIAGDILQGYSSGNYYLVVIKSGHDNIFKLVDLTENVVYGSEHSGESLLRAIKEGMYNRVANTKSLTLDLSEGYVQ